MPTANVNITDYYFAGLFNSFQLDQLVDRIRNIYKELNTAGGSQIVLDKLTKPINELNHPKRETSPIYLLHPDLRAMMVGSSGSIPSAYMMEQNNIEDYISETSIPTGYHVDVTNQVTTYLIEQQLYHLEQLYTFDQSGIVKDYILKNPNLAGLLLEAYSELSRFFGSNPTVKLAVTIDPEEGFRELFAYVKTTAPVGEAIDKLDAFDAEWFLDNLYRAENKLNFNLEFE